MTMDDPRSGGAWQCHQGFFIRNQTAVYANTVEFPVERSVAGTLA